jgi:hypothetical protein
MNKKFRNIVTISWIVLLSIAAYYMIHLFFIAGTTKIGTIDNLKVYTTTGTVYKNDIAQILDSCIVLLRQNNIYTKSNGRIILCTSADQYSRKVFFIHRNSLGINQPLFRTIIMAPADFKNNRYSKSDERLINRSLSDAIVHEITHTYIHEKMGFFQHTKTRMFQNWKIEGFCEYVANSSSFDIEKGKRIFLGDIQLENEMLDSRLMKITYFYFKSRLRADFLLSYKGLTFDEFFNTKFDVNELEDEIRQKLLFGEFALNRQ